MAGTSTQALTCVDVAAGVPLCAPPTLSVVHVLLSGVLALRVNALRVDVCVQLVGGIVVIR